MFEGESVMETMPGESAPKEANTCVFWDVDDCPIPSSLYPDSIYQNIKSALANNCYDGKLEIKLYGGQKTLSDQLMLDAGLTFVPKVSARTMIYDMAVWALDNRKSNLLVISQDVTEDPLMLHCINDLGLHDFTFLLAQSHELHKKLQSKLEVLDINVPLVWIWTSLLDGGTPLIIGWEPNLDYESDHFSVDSDVESTMSGESSPRRYMTGYMTIFWDFADMPIPMGLCLYTVKNNFILALEKLGYHIEFITFWLYVHEQKLSDDIVKDFQRAEMEFIDKVPKGKLARVSRMLLDIHLWALDNPSSEFEPMGDLMVVSRKLSKEPELVQRLVALNLKGYKILLLTPEELTLGGTLSTKSLDWLWETMFTNPTSASAECGNSDLVSPYQGIRRTEVFWDLVDYPIPDGVDFLTATKNIISALLAAKESYSDIYSFRFYYDEEQPHVDELVIFYRLLYFFPNVGDKLMRVEKMLMDILLCAKDHEHDFGTAINVMLVSKNISVTGLLVNCVFEGLRSRHCNVVLIHPDGETPMPSVSTLSPEWLWKSLLGKPNNMTGRDESEIENIPAAWGFDNNVSTSVFISSNSNFQSLKAMFEGVSSFKTKSGESAQSNVIPPREAANTCVFWDMDDCPIPNGLDPVSICRNIKSALANNGYYGKLEIRLYGGQKTLSDQVMLDAGLTFVLTVSARVLIYDMIFWAMDNLRSNLLVISRDIPEDPLLRDIVFCLGTRGCNVLLAQSDELHSKLQSEPETLPCTVSQLWIVTSLLDGEAPIIGQRGHKRKDNVTDSELRQ